MGDSMRKLDNDGKQLKPFIIVEASSAMQMEQRVLDFMSEGYELFGQLSLSPKGVFV